MMLVLSRTANEELMIGDDIRIIVIGIRGNNVRLGIEAPENVSVHRKEVYDSIQREGERRGKEETQQEAEDEERERSGHPRRQVRRVRGESEDGTRKLMLRKRSRK